jgi:hypothetical protein
MSYASLTRWDDPLVIRPYRIDPAPRLGQWELVGSMAAAAGASYGTILWGESDVSRFFSTVYGQVITTALNLVGSIWGIPLGSIVQGIAEMFGGIFGGDELSHEDRERAEFARAAPAYKAAIAQMHTARTFTQLYNVLVNWSTPYVGGTGGGTGNYISFRVRPLIYAPPDVQPVSATGLGRALEGERDLSDMAIGSYGLWRGADLRRLPLEQWPWIFTGYTGKPSYWYATTTETGFFRALIADPVKRFSVQAQLGVSQSYLDPVNRQMADVIRGATAKIIQRDYGPAINQAIALAEATVSGTIPSAPATAAVMQKVGVAPGVVPTVEQIQRVMEPAKAASPGVQSNQLPWLLAAGVGAFALLGG